MDLEYQKISPDAPARVTVYRDAFDRRSEDHLEFASLEELAEGLRFKRPLKRRIKTKAPMFVRGRCDGERAQENTDGPLVVILDCDQVEAPPELVSRRLEIAGVDHVWHTTWSDHSPEKPKGHCYRVFVDYTSPTWEGLETITRRMFQLAGLKGDGPGGEVTRESWQTLGVFTPSTHPRRFGKYRHGAVLSSSGSTCAPPGYSEPTRTEAPERTGDGEIDAEELLEALAFVDNEEHAQWIEVGAALHWTGAPDAYDVWVEWSASQDSSKFDEEDCEKRWRSFGKRAGRLVTLGTIYKLARLGGWRPPDRRRKAADVFLEHGSKRARKLHELNAQYGYLGRGRLGTIADFRENGEVDFLGVEAFQRIHYMPIKSGELYLRGEKKGEPVYKPAGEVWMRWKKRRTYRYLDFLPSGSGEKLPTHTLNLWTGFKYEPRAEECGLFLEHIKKVICSGDDYAYRWVLAWLAHLVQRPWEKPETAIVLRGQQGTGKGCFFKTIAELCAPASCQVTKPDHLLGKFNNHLAGRIFVFADEVMWGGRTLDGSILKGLVSEEMHLIESKGVDVFRARCFARFGIASNESWVVKAERDARRWQAFEVPSTHRNDLPYFNAIRAEMDGGGYNGLMHYLLGLELEELPNPRQIFDTTLLVDQKIKSLGHVEAWIHGFLAAGEVAEGEGWRTYLPTSNLYEDYLARSRDVGVTRKSAETQVWGTLETILGLRKERKRVEGVRARWAVLPELEEARRRFSTWLGSDVTWEQESGPLG